MKECDVCIIGAGISGLTVAKILSKNGIGVLVVEKEGEIGRSHDNKIDVAEVKGLKEYVKELDVEPFCITHKSRWHSPNHSFELELREEDSYFFRRGTSEDSIENQLAEDIEEKILFETEFASITKKEDYYEVAVSRTDGKQKLKARVVVGADGVDSQVAKLCGFPEQKPRKIIGYGINFTGGFFESRVPEVYFNTEYFAGGYLYVAPCPDNTITSVGVMDPLRTKNSQENFKSFVRSTPKFEDIKVLNGILGEGVISGPRKQTLKGNILLVGDAAGVMDPLFGYGLRGAIATGHHAGKTLVNALENGDMSALEGYEEEWRRELGPSLDNGLSLRKVFDRTTNDDFNHVIRLLDKIKNSGVDFNEIFVEYSHKRHTPHIFMNLLLEPKKTLSLLKKFI